MDLKKLEPKRTYTAPQIIKLNATEASDRLGARSGQGQIEDEFKLRALVLTTDDQVNKIFATCFFYFRTAIQSCETEDEAMDKFSSQKFDAIVLDFDSFAGVLPNREKFQQNHANRHAVMIAIATGVERPKAVKYGASFIFEKPVKPAQVEQVLRAAYGLMLRDRREYFRLGAELPVSFRTKTGTQLEGMTINISRSGMAFTTPSPLEIGTLINFKLQFEQTSEPLYGTAKVIWDDRHGKAGLAFQGHDQKSQAAFSEWLDRHFYIKFDLMET